MKSEREGYVLVKGLMDKGYNFEVGKWPYKRENRGEEHREMEKP